MRARASWILVSVSIALQRSFGTRPPLARRRFTFASRESIFFSSRSRSFSALSLGIAAIASCTYCHAVFTETPS